MIKPTKRKAFNFLRSYFDVFNELKTDSDKLKFLTAIIEKQFLNKDPKDLNFVVNLCYESQRHQIESSVKGWERASKETLSTTPSTTLPTTSLTPKQEEEEKEEEKEEGKEEGKVQRSKAKPSNIQEVIDYFKEKKILNHIVNAEKFYHHYEANGWMRGKNKIKSWKSCVSTWNLPKEEPIVKEQMYWVEWWKKPRFKCNHTDMMKYKKDYEKAEVGLKIEEA